MQYNVCGDGQEALSGFSWRCADKGWPGFCVHSCSDRFWWSFVLSVIYCQRIMRNAKPVEGLTLQVGELRLLWSP